MSTDAEPPINTDNKNICDHQWIYISDHRCNKNMNNPKIAIIVGSSSDVPQIEKAEKILKEFGVSYELKVLSAHRTPDALQEYVRSSGAKGVEVIIAAAGKAAALPGVIASLVTLPVIGIPIKSSFLDGMDSLLSIVQMPEGIPVGCMGVSNAANAALYAAQILSLKYPLLRKKIIAHRKKQEKAIKEFNEHKKSIR